MKKYVISFGLIIAFVIYVALQSQGSSQVSGGLAVNSAATSGSGTGTGTGSGTGTSPSQSQAAQSPSAPQAQGSSPQPASAGIYKNGSYTGPAADAYYGTVQVKAIVTGGKLSNVKILQEPNDNGHSQEVSYIALPYLVQEAISAQSANIYAVSGATQTSQAFMQSLAAALSAAKA